MAAPIVYRSTDTSAPVLTGAVGDLVNLLDKCLVAGYGSKAAAGWTKPFTTGSHSAVFRMGGGTQMYLDVNDNGPGAGTYKEARVKGYETMSAVATGTGPFPTVAQKATGLFVRKSATADATARAWEVIADDKTVHIFISTGDVAGTYFAWSFGDIFSFLTGDAYRCLLIARATENTAAVTVTDDEFAYSAAGTGTNAAMVGHFMPRLHTGLGGAITVLKVGDISALSTAATEAVLLGAHPYPNPTDGGLYISPLYVVQVSNGRRGYIRGLYHFCHPAAAVADQDTFSGASGGAYNGKTFKILKTVQSTACIVVETSAWDTSS